MTPGEQYLNYLNSEFKKTPLLFKEESSHYSLAD